MALVQEKMTFQSPVYYWVGEQHGEENGYWVRTSAGRVLFNSIIPDELGYKNRTFGKKELGDLVFECFDQIGLAETPDFLDNLKDFGFRYATMGGISVGIDPQVGARVEHVGGEGVPQRVRRTAAGEAGARQFAQDDAFDAAGR